MLNVNCLKSLSTVLLSKLVMHAVKRWPQDAPKLGTW